MEQSDRRKLWSGEGDRGRGAENDKVLIESVAPAWAALIQFICGLCHSMAVKSPEDIYSTLHPKEWHPVIAATISCLAKNNGRVVWSPAPDQPHGSKAGQWVTVTDACFISATNRPSQPLIHVGRQAGLHVVDILGPSLQALYQAAKTSGKRLSFFSPAILRQALRQAGNVVQDSPAWRQIAKCRLGRNAPFLLESTLMKVRVPTVNDLANSLPLGWKDVDSAVPDQAWLEQFWAMAARQQWQNVPPALTGF
ncbi:hypothetical protein WJX82_008032 [Trebouxia sp. C0006]